MKAILRIVLALTASLAILAVLLLLSLEGNLPLRPAWIGSALAINLLCLFALPFLVLGRLRRFVADITCALGGNITPTEVPQELHLLPIQDPDWGADVDFEEAEDEFLRLGFEHLGNFEAQEVNGLHLSAWADVEASAWGVVYMHPQAGVFVDLCAPRADGGTLTVTNAPAGEELDERPGHPKHFLKGASLAKLQARFLRECAGQSLAPISPEQFQSYFERVYREGMAWRTQRGTTEEEVRRVAANMNEVVSEGTIRQTARLHRKHGHVP